MRGRRSVSLAWWADYPHQWEAGGQALWEVERQPNEDLRSCWRVPFYEQQTSTCGYLVLHARRGNGNDGGEITLAINDTPRYEIYAQASFTAARRQGA